MSGLKESKEDELESQKAQEVIGLLLRKPDEDCTEALTYPAVCKTEPDLPSSSITVSISDASPLNICQVSLTDAAGMILEPNDILRQSLDGTSSIQLEDGTTAFVQSFEPVDEADSGDATARFIDGQAVQLEDGSTAFIHAAPREGLQPVQLEDGTVAYLSQTGAELFNGEASTLDLEHISTSQLVDADVKEMDLKVESFNKSTTTKVAEKAFQCEFPNCKRLYTTLHHLKVHERSHTGDRPFKCKSCTKSFATGYGLKSHTRVHTGETPYKCPDEACHKAFKTSGDLQKHVRTHTGERPFKCSFSGCDRAFTTSNIRKVHIRTHTGERPYICKEEGCGRAFASATNYKNHIRIHTGEKPYLCAVSGCNKRFTEYSSLYKHHVVHTHFKPYACNLCGKNYRQTSTLAMHKRTAHGILEQNEEEEMISEAVEKTEESLELKKKAVNTIPKENEKDNKCANVQLDTKDSSSVKTTFPTIVALQGETSAQLLQEHPVYAVQLQDDGTLSNMQQIVLVTDSSQLATLQHLAQQGQFETTVLSSVTGEADLSTNATT
ncbi:zinc finger protein 76 [Parasteatoda tepidariorum]|uniref:zinc finger protein 76 n=1 Tax=Parasteatoda tepidariorum TaxID=114398 RepID=UPI001C71F780|nr:zinc finger protein 76 [Parasteatoda tepidariorum]XP_015916956.2 zinc finger protein 76 [Parasteatoda tepidariorum]XP_015916958.2 zinc finger protein 76 [Parasteatoda tepidariorum]XP_015916959.2 zinc finger protein 76 [Parasteatoda tepidariorum]